ncbi:hypothetical protein, partial [Saccharothrix sp. ST-888]|uniref:hypothetical protein n=1 Tax=Saccharothrix sp. ST-888 TaxID=1427391 RepID=UPI0005ED27FB
TLLMCAPGEYHLALLPGSATPSAFAMPFAMTAYAGIAAPVASHRSKGLRARFAAIPTALTPRTLTLPVPRALRRRPPQYRPCTCACVGK